MFASKLRLPRPEEALPGRPEPIPVPERHFAEQRAAAQASREAYALALAARGLGPVTTEIRDAPPFYYAEEYHQQYLARNPGGYCGLGGTGVSCPVGTGVAGGEGDARRA